MSKDSTDALAEALFQAHLAFSLSSLTDSQIKALLEDVIQQGFQKGRDISLRQVLNHQKASQLIQSVIRGLPEQSRLYEQQIGVLGNLLQSALQASTFDQASLDQFVTRADFCGLITRIAQHDALREDVIRLMLKTPVYSDLISDVLYQGIKDYILNENIVAKRLPGISALMKVGAQGLNKAMPKLEEAAEQAIKKTIAENLNRSVQLSERFLNKALSEDKIKVIADHLWEKLADKPFSSLKRYVDAEAVPHHAQEAGSLISRVCQSELMSALIEEWTAMLLDAAGDRSLTDLAEELGLSEAVVASKLPIFLASASFSEAIERLVKTRLQAHLRAFYDSEAFRQALAQESD